MLYVWWHTKNSTKPSPNITQWLVLASSGPHSACGELYHQGTEDTSPTLISVLSTPRPAPPPKEQGP